MDTAINLQQMASTPMPFPSRDAYSLPAEQSGPAVRACLQHTSARDSLEEYIASVFEAIHGATLNEFLPLLCGLQKTGDWSAALGLRAATREFLFCEQYLDHSVEEEVYRTFGCHTKRSSIMELGNLVSSSAGQSVLLYLMVVRALHQSGINYLIFTANRAVRASIRRCGFKTTELCDADPARLGFRASGWGSYYEGQPKVIIADLGLANAHGEEHHTIAAAWREHAADIAQLADAVRIAAR